MERDKQFFAAIAAIREVLAQPEQEPVAWVWTPAKEAWEKVHAFGHWQQEAIYAFGPTMPSPLTEPQQKEPMQEIARLHERIKDLEKDVEFLSLSARQQEPVAWRVRWPRMGGGYKWIMNDAPLMAEHGFVNEPLYTSPPASKPWVGLTDEEIGRCFDSADGTIGSLIAAIEAKLREKNA